MTGRILKRFSNPPTSARNALVTLAALAVWALFLWRGLGTFGPDRDLNDVDFNSDSAIPVLMSNEDRPITVFNLYYYGADRWGGWPLLVTRFIRHLTGFRWTPESLFIVQAVWVFLGAVIFAGLSGSDRFVAGAVYLVALCLHSEARFLLFELSQTYAWQTTALLLGWYSARRMFDAFLEPSQTRLTRRVVTWFAASIAFSFLAAWSSVASTPLLVFLMSVEALRGVLRRGVERIEKRALTAYGLGLTSVLIASLVERLQKMNYHRHGLRHYGDDFQAHFRLDTGHLTDNLVALSAELGKLSWWPLYVVPAIALIALGGALVYVVLRGHRGQLAKVSAVLSQDTVIVALGSCGIAVMNFALAVTVDHVRYNGYDTRFLTLTNLFGPVSGMFVMFLVMKSLVGTTRLAYVQPTLVVIALALLTVKFPAAPNSAAYELDKATARTLARRAPGQILMGTFWETYVFTALQPQGAAMIPIPFQDQKIATPWTPRLLHRSEQVIVAFRRERSGGVPRLAPALRQHGVTLRLVDPNWYENQAYVFAVYINEDAR
jgi:hypothetical protein